MSSKITWITLSAWQVAENDVVRIDGQRIRVTWLIRDPRDPENILYTIGGYPVGGGSYRSVTLPRLADIEVEEVVEVADPYIFIGSEGTAWFFYPATRESQETECKISDLSTDLADALLSHGFRVVIEGVNDDDTLASATAGVAR